MAKNVAGEGIRPHEWRGRWRGGVTIGFDAAGKQQIKWLYGKTSAECQAKINDAKRRRDEGTLRLEKSMSVAQWLEHWLEVKRAQVEPRTHEEYEYTSRHLLPRIGRVKLDKLSPMQVQRMQLEVREAVSARAAVKARGLLFNAMSDALKLGLVPRNVVALVDPVKYQTEEFTIWSAAEIVRFLKHAERADYYALWYTALTTGMRPGELIALHWEDVREGTLHVTRTVSVVANKPVLKPHTKTKHGKRILALPDDTASILAQLREVAEGPLVFPSRREGFLSHRNLRRALHTYATKAEVPIIRQHDMRHTYAAMRIADGVDIMTLSRDLGHSSPSFTLNRYGHIFDGYRKREAPSLNRLLKLDNGTGNGTAPQEKTQSKNGAQDLPS